MQRLSEKLHAPELDVTDWGQGEPTTLKSLRGKVVLIDFWDYTCINCLHTLPYLKAWHERYHHAGLEIIGLHAPEFSFAKDREQLRAALTRLDLPYPVALDNDFKTWQHYANRAWPAKYLIDQDGYIKAYHTGEGAYDAFELEIQQLLQTQNSELTFPAPVTPFRPEDAPGAKCYRPTPELYCGSKRSGFGNDEGARLGEVVGYTLPAVIEDDTLYLQGAWAQDEECITSSEPLEEDAIAAFSVTLKYNASGINAVLRPSGSQAIKIKLGLNGDALPHDLWGKDVVADHQTGDAVVVVDGPRMYHLVENPYYATHTLTLLTDVTGLCVYAFTFTSPCER